MIIRQFYIRSTGRDVGKFSRSLSKSIECTKQIAKIHLTKVLVSVEERKILNTIVDTLRGYIADMNNLAYLTCRTISFGNLYFTIVVGAICFCVCDLCQGQSFAGAMFAHVRSASG